MIPDFPEAVSRGWFSGRKMVIGIRRSAIASTEIRRLTRADAAAFWKGYDQKTSEHNIKVTHTITSDEFNDFVSKRPSHVQSSKKERSLPTGRSEEHTQIPHHTHSGYFVLAVVERQMLVVHGSLFEGS